MNNKFLALAVLAMFTVLALAGLSSAYTYYGGVYGNYGSYQNDYDRTTYHVTRTSGSGAYITQKDTFYDRQSEQYVNARGQLVDRTTYVKETVENPGYYGGYSGYNSGYYGNSYYNPWYQKYWSNDRYNRYGYNYGYSAYDPYRYY